MPSGPPPKQLIVKERKKGTGAVVQPGRVIEVNYVALEYETGREFQSAWGKDSLSGCWGTDEFVGAWELGLKGMRVGGRRELISPAPLAYGSSPLVYWIELIGVA